MDFDFLDEAPDEPPAPKALGATKASDALAFLGNPEMVEPAATVSVPSLELLATPGKAGATEPGGEPPLPAPRSRLEYRAGLQELKRRGLALEATRTMLSLSEIYSPPVTFEKRESARRELPIIEADLLSATQQVNTLERVQTDTHWVFFFRRRKLRARFDALVDKQRRLQSEFDLAARAAGALEIDEAAELRRQAKAAVERHKVATDEYKLKYSFWEGGVGGGGGGGEAGVPLSDNKEAAERKEWYESLRRSEK